MTFRGKFAKTKDEFRRISFALLLQFYGACFGGVSQCAQQKATVTSIVLLIKYAHMPCFMSRSACRVMHACPCHHLFVGSPVDGHMLRYFPRPSRSKTRTAPANSSRSISFLRRTCSAIVNHRPSHPCTHVLPSPSPSLQRELLQQPCRPCSL